MHNSHNTLLGLFSHLGGGVRMIPLRPALFTSCLAVGLQTHLGTTLPILCMIWDPGTLAKGLGD